ncbi:MAG: hypothetical protein AAF741_10485 [Bacteroidota bacterium]
MKNLSYLLLAFAGLYLIAFSTGCGEDTPGGGTGTDLPPEIVLESGAGIISTTTDLSLADPFTVRVRIDDGDAPLESLAITQNGTNVPFGDLEFDGGAVTSNNPLLITGASTSGVTYDITISPSSPSVGANTFLFTVTDENDQFSSTSITINYTDLPNPTATLIDAMGFISADATLTAGEAFDVRVELDDNGVNPLATFQIQEDGVLLPTANLEFLGQTFDPANPLALITSEQMGVTFDLRITPTSSTAGTSVYSFQVLDDRGSVGSASINITFEESTVTALMGVLFNQGGDTGTGGLDLDTGTGTGSNDAAAEIQDEGINTDIVVAQNWRRQISAANDATLREVSASSLPESQFASVTTQAQIIAAYDAGTVPNGDDSDCNCTDTVDNEEVSDVEVGDLFGVLRDGRYYLIEVVEVNLTTANNEDNYVVNIKF